MPAIWRCRSASRGNRREDLVEPLGIFARRALGEGAELEILGDRHGAEQLPAFRHQRKAARRLDVGRQPRHVLAVEHDAAAPRRDGAGDRAQRRGLAGAVGADDGGELAAPRLERNAPQHLHLAVAGFERFDLEQRVRHARAPLQLGGELGIAQIGLDHLRIVARLRPAGPRRASRRN